MKKLLILAGLLFMQSLLFSTHNHTCSFTDDYDSIINVTEIRPLISCDCTMEEIIQVALVTGCYMQIMHLAHLWANSNRISPELNRIITTLISYSIGKTCATQAINILYCFKRLFT